MTTRNVTSEILDVFCQLDNLSRSFDFKGLESLIHLCGTKIGDCIDFKPDILRSIARKCGLPPSLIILCIDWLCDSLEKPDNGIVAEKISQAIRYSVKNLCQEHDIDADSGCQEQIFRLILSAYRKFNDPEIKSQLTWALGYLTPNLSFEFDLPHNIFASSNNISENAKEFLFDQIRRKNRKRISIDSICDSSLPNFGAIEFPHNVKNRAGVYVTQTQTAVAITSNHFESEKTKVLLLSLFENLKAKKDRLKDRFMKTDQTPNEEAIKEGSDLRWYRDTYNEVSNLLRIAESNCIDLRHEDVNVYLEGKLLAYHFWTWNWGGKSTEQLNLDISKIVLIYSKTHPLDDNLVGKLLECVSITPSFGKFSPANLGTLRYNAIQALYNCSLRKTIFSSPYRFQVIDKWRTFKNHCAKDKEIIAIVFKILKNCTSNTDNSELFEMALSQLERTEDDTDVDEYLHTIRKQTWNALKADECFTTQVKDRLITIINSNQFMTKRKGCADIIHSYLTFSSADGILTLKQFKILLNVILESDMSIAVFPSIILGLEKGCLRSAFNPDDLRIIVHSIVSCISNLSEEAAYFAIIALAKAVDQKNVYVHRFNEYLISKLFDETQAIQTESGIKFVRPVNKSSEKVSENNGEKTDNFNCNKNLNRGTAISYYVADLCLKSLNRSEKYDLKNPSLETLLNCLEQNRDKQTRICVAEILYCKRKHFDNISAETVARLANLTRDPVVDVRIFSVSVYVYFLSKDCIIAIYDDDIGLICDFFVYDQLTLGDKDFTDEINNSIMTIFLNVAKNDQTIPDNVFEIFNYILSVDKNYVDSVLLGLHTIVSHNKEIPLQTMFALENVLCRGKLIFEKCIENGQKVTEKVIDSLVKDLYCHNKDASLRAFKLLDNADGNQDLGDVPFGVLEMERAGRVHELSPHIVSSLKYLLECVNSGKLLTPYNFEAFTKIIGTDEQVTTLTTNILNVVISEHGKPIPDLLLSKLNSVVNTTSDKILISSFCQLVSHVLNNNQIISDSKMIMSKLEHFLELQLSDQEFSDIFHAIVAIAKTESSDDVIKLSDEIILKLLLRIQSDELCRKHFAKFLPKIIKCTESSDVIKHAKIVFRRCISSSEYNVAFHCAVGFLEISKNCESNLNSKDLTFLLQSSGESDDERFNKIVLEIVDRYSLTPEQIVERDYVTANRNVEHYFERLTISEDRDDRKGVKKYLACVKDIFASDNIVLIGKAVALLKLLSINRDMVHLITTDILSALIGIEQLNDDLLLSVYEIVKETVDFQKEGKAFFLSIVEIEKLCEFAKDGKKHKKFFQKLLYAILDKYQLPSHDQQKIEMTIFFASTRINSLESIKTLQQKVLDGTSLDFDQTKSVIDDVHKIVGQTSTMSDAMAKILLVFTDLISMLLIQGKIKFVDLQVDSQLMEIIEFVIKNPSKMPVTRSYVVKGFEMILKHAASLDGCNTSSYFDLIPSILESLQMNKLDFKIASAQYILTYIESCNLHGIDVNSCPAMINFLENGLNDSENLIRTASFDSLRKLHQIGKSSKTFQEWSLDQLKSISKSADIPLTLELSEDNLDILHTICLARFFSLKILKGNSPSSIRYEILSNDIFQRYRSASTDVLTYTFSNNFTTLSSNDFYSNNTALFCNVLEKLLLAVDHGHIRASDLDNTIVFLMHIGFQTFSELIQTQRQSLFNELRRKAIFAMILNKLGDSLQNRETANGLVHAIEAKINFQDLSKLLNHIESIDSVETMRLALNFFSKNHLNTNELSLSKCADTSQMLKQLQAYHLTKRMSPEDTKLKTKTLLTQLFDREFSFDQLEPLFHPFNNPNGQVIAFISESVKSIITLFVQFGVDPKKRQTIECVDRISKFMKEKPAHFSDWFIKANSFIVEYIFENGSEDNCTIKPLKQLLNELKVDNVDTLANLKYDDEKIDDLRIKVENIRNRNECRVLFNYEPLENDQQRCRITKIDSWKKKDFQTWAKEVKTYSNYFKNKEFIEEALAVLMGANYKCYNYQLRDTQILSCLLGMSSNTSSDRGLLQQVVTGGGKSTIIRLLAILLALNGRRVFIVTSNPVLAERDANESRQLFEMFNLTVDHNRDQQNYIRGPKSCYSKSVVFGDASQFQFDILRDEYSCLGTLDGWKLDVVIVDEVDNMFIDDSSKFTRLSSTLPGMDQLHLIYHFVWQKLNEIQSRIFRIENRTFLALGKLDLVDGVLSLAIDVGDGNIVRIENFDDHILQGNDTKDLCIEIEDVTEGITTHLKNFLFALLSDQTVVGYEIKPENKMLVPKHLRSFVESQISRWVDNALTALQYWENVHYIVDKDIIKPVDFDTTGVIQNCTSWSDGLHQFLQIKHNLPMTSENLATNYLSTLGFFKRFKSQNIYGFTGTFGSEAAKKHTAQLYSVDLIKVPNSSTTRYFHYEDLVLPTKKDWISAIVQSTEFETKKNRACLIICRTIREAEFIYQILSEKAVRANSVKLYTSNLTNEEKCVEKIGAGEVIVATNLAGRGTDIKTEKIVEVSGGLHVCMTFLPTSQRAGDQAIGRTSRLNNVGTAQFILLGSTTSNKNLRAQRDNDERKFLEEFRINTLHLITTKDELFEKFCKLLQFVREKLILQKSGTKKIASFFGRNIPSVYETNMLSSVEERWALFVRSVESELDRDRIWQTYEEFESKIRSTFKGDNPKDYINVIESPYYATCIGNDFVYNGKTKIALKYFNHAIALDESFSAAALVGKGWCLVSPECRFLYFNDPYDIDYKNEAIKVMELGLKLLVTEKAYLATSQILSSSLSSINEETGLSKQLLQKLSILGNYINSVEMAIYTVRKSQRLVDISYRKGNLKQDMISCEHHYRNKREELDVKYNSKEYSIDVTFHDLTCRYDCGTHDQAIDLISRKQSIGPISSSLDLQLQLLGADSDNILAYFSPDIEHRLKSKNEALKLLNIDENLDENASMSTFKQKLMNLIPKKKVSTKIDCTIYQSDGKIYNLYQNSQEEVIKKLEDSHVSNTFDIKLYDVNDTPKTFKKAKFELSLLQISAENAKKIFDTIDTETKLSVKFFGSTKDLIEYCRNLDRNPELQNLKSQTHFQKDGNVRITKPTFIATEHLELIDCDFCCVELHVSAKTGLTLLTDDWPKNFSIDILSKSLDLTSVCQLLKIHKGGRIDLAINADTEFAKELIPLLRDAKFEFALKFLNLKYCQANELIKSDIGEEDIIINKELTKRFPSLYLTEHVPKEIVEFMSRGLEYLLVFNERRFIPWYSIASICALGVLQLIVGGLLIATGLGAPVGMAFCTEGSVDLMIALRTYQTRNFSWKDYGIQKSLSLLVSASSLGLGMFKNAGQGISSVIQSVQTEAVEQGVVQLFLNGRTVCSVAAESASSLKVLALKQMGIAVAEAAARETLFQLSSKVTNYLFDQFEDTIEKSVSITLKFAVYESSLLDLLNKLFAYEKHVKTQYSMKDIIFQHLEDIINPDNESWKKYWNSIGIMICQGVASSSQSLNNSIALGARLFTMLWGAVEIKNMESDLCRQLVDKLQKYEERAFSLVEVIVKICNLTPGDANIFLNVTRKHCNNPIETLNDLLVEENMLSIRHIQIAAFKEMECFGTADLAIAQNELLNKCTAIKKSLESISNPFDHHSEIIQKIVNATTQQIVQVSHTQLITPVSSLAVGHLVRKISTYAQTNFIVSQEQNSSSQNKDQLKYDRLMNQIIKGETISEDEINFVCNYKDERINMTIARQISHNAADLQTAINILDMSHCLEKVSSGGKIVTEEQTNYAKSVESCRKKAGLLEIMHLSEVNSCKLIVTDDVNEVEELRQKFSDHHFLVYNQKQASQSRSFQLFDSSGALVIVPANSNGDTGYKILEHLTGQKEKELRKIMANDIINDENMRHKIKAESLYEKYTKYGQDSTNTLVSNGVQIFTENLPSIINRGRLLLNSNRPDLISVNTASVTSDSLEETQQKSSLSLYWVTAAIVVFITLSLFILPLGLIFTGLIALAIFMGTIYYLYLRNQNTI